MTIHFNTINSLAQFYPKAKLPVQPVFNFSSLNLKSSKSRQFSAFLGQGVFFATPEPV